MTSKERICASLSHKEPDRIPIDFGGTAVTGMHVSCVAGLREYYGLEKKPVTMYEPFQCLGLIEDDLSQAIGVDAAALQGASTWFGFKNENFKEWRTPWGQDVLVAGNFNTTSDAEGNTYIYPMGDISAPASGHMPAGGFFFDEIIRQDPLPDEDSELKVEDNLEEFPVMSDADIAYLKAVALRIRDKNMASVASLGGTGLGDIAVVPAPALRHPKGIRDITEWYVSTVSRRDFVYEIFERQIDIALGNLKRINEAFGDLIDVIFTCGTDFGTQDSTFCSPEAYRDLYMPHYKRTNDWIHEHTKWKIFKHSCGSIPAFIPLFIESGFDIINPVQCSAKGMAPEFLKREFGKDISFWGGGVDTQKTLPFGTPEEVRKEVLSRCEIFAKDGGFIFNAIHNVQAKTPVRNIAAMIEAVHEFNGER
jgi:hypothetical protein